LSFEVTNPHWRNGLQPSDLTAPNLNIWLLKFQTLKMGKKILPFEFWSHKPLQPELRTVSRDNAVKFIFEPKNYQKNYPRPNLIWPLPLGHPRPSGRLLEIKALLQTNLSFATSAWIRPFHRWRKSHLDLVTHSVYLALQILMMIKITLDSIIGLRFIALLK
jgi:hypothetical protein